jgi:hypothetical protein
MNWRGEFFVGYGYSVVLLSSMAPVPACPRSSYSDGIPVDGASCYLRAFACIHACMRRYAVYVANWRRCLGGAVSF